jgi:hypothetical protein
MSTINRTPQPKNPFSHRSLTLVGLFGLGLGAILRKAAGGITALAGILFMPPHSWTAFHRAGITRSPRISRATRDRRSCKPVIQPRPGFGGRGMS